MKKYHHNPTLGVKSESSKWTPYVDRKNSQEFEVIKYDNPSNPDMHTRNSPAYFAAYLEKDGVFDLFFASYASMITGGSSRTGYSERYDAIEIARIAGPISPSTAFAMPVKIAVFVKAIVDLAKHVAIVKGLSRNAAAEAHGGHEVPFLLDE